MYVIAIDYGEKRVGTAVASTIARLPRPLSVVPNDDHLIEELTQLAAREQASGLVVGIPRNMDGSLGKQAEICRQFGEQIGTATGLPVTFVEETLTSVEAAVRAKEFDKNIGVDAVAAACILERYFMENFGGAHGLA